MHNRKSSKNSHFQKHPQTYGFSELAFLDVQLLEQTVGGILGHYEVLMLLVDLHLDLLDATILLSERILRLLVSAAFLVEGGLEVSDSGLQLGDHTFSAEKGGRFGFLDLDLELFDLLLERLAQGVDLEGVLLNVSVRVVGRDESFWRLCGWNIFEKCHFLSEFRPKLCGFFGKIWVYCSQNVFFLENSPFRVYPRKMFS